jgi:hypothetical protein
VKIETDRGIIEKKIIKNWGSLLYNEGTNPIQKKRSHPQPIKKPFHYWKGF